MEKQEKVITGEVVIVQRPHRDNTKLYWYIDIDKAFESFSEIVYDAPSLNEQIQQGCFDTEGDKDTIAFIKQQLSEEGIDEDTPYFEIMFDWSYDKYFKKTAENKERIVNILAQDDMNAGHVFIAEEGETYEDFANRIYEYTRGHNEPSYREIYQCLSVEDSDA